MDTIIDAFGATRLVKVGNQYFLRDGSGAGPALKRDGEIVVAGQFAGWTPIGTEQTESGYQVVWKKAASGQYSVWTLDGSGNFLSTTGAISGTSSVLKALEPIFDQDLNGDGSVSIGAVIEATGSTSLVEIGNQYFLRDGSGAGPVLKKDGTAVLEGQIANWTPIATEQTESGYLVAWKNTKSGQYSVWTLDGSGNFLSTTGAISGTSSVLKALEPDFHQDLNGDGVVLTPAVIEAFGSTSLVEIGNQFYLRDETGAGPLLKRDGKAVVEGQSPGWSAIAAEQTASGYLVVWRKGTSDQYIVWTVDGSGNYVSKTDTVSGVSSTVQSLEPVFGQDLNGDGSVSIGAMIETLGSTSLVEVGNQYFLLDGSGAGPVLKKDGTAVVEGQIANWTPIATEQTGSGYLVAWKNTKSGQYSVWTLDGSGNFLSTTGAISGTSSVLKALEPDFHQDLNGDGVVLAPAVIEAFGSTSLVEIGNQYFLRDGTGAGPVLKRDGKAVVEGQFEGWTPIGTERTESGYQVVWRKDTSGQYSVWTVDGSGNFLSTTGAISGTSSAVQRLEPIFGQDLNGDGSVSTGAAIETFGSTGLFKVGNQYLLSDGVSGQVLKRDGAAVVAGQFAGWTPIATEQTESGYQVVWKKAASGQYSVWTLDGSGNFLSTTGAISGTSSVLKALEPGFHQDLNGDGKIEHTPTFAGLSTTATTISFTATDLDGGSLGLSSPFGTALGPVANGALTTLTLGAQATALSGVLRVTDGANVVDVMGLYLGTDGDDTAAAPSAVLPNAIYGFGGNDTIVGAQNDMLLDGGDGFDTLRVGANFTSSGDAQISNIERVLLTQAVTLDLSNQTENLTIIGSSGADTITAGQGYNLVFGRGGADTLSGGASWDRFAYVSTSDSTHAAYDTILDFTPGEDNLDFWGLGALGPLVTVTTAPAMIAAHTIVAFVSGGNTVVYVNDTDGDLATDLASMEIHLTGVTGLSDDDLYMTALNYGVWATPTSLHFDLGVLDDVSVTGPFAGIFGHPVVVDFEVEFTPVVQASEVSGILQILKGANTYDIMGLYLGTGGNDSATAPSGSLSNILYGFAGNDTLTGSSTSENWLVGGTGNDSYYVNSGSDHVIEAAGEGIDTIYTSTGFALEYLSEIEVLRVYGTTDGVLLFGNEFNNTLIGGVGGDWLEGGFGADTLSGGAGGDIFSYVSGSDSKHAAYDTILDFVVGEDKLNFRDLGTFGPLVTVTTAPTTIAAHTIEAFVSGGSTILYVNNTGGPLAADAASMEIHLAGVTGLTDSDIVVFDPDGPNEAPVISDIAATATSISFVATDPEGHTLQLLVSGSPFDVDVISGGTTTLQAVFGDPEVTYFLQVTDGSSLVDVMGVYFGNDGNNENPEVGILPLALYGFGGDDTLRGGTGADWIFGGDGNDTIYGAQNDTLLDGGADTDTLRVAADFTSTGDAQIANIENVVLAQAVTLDLSNQSEGFTITGSSGADSITGGADDDLIYGAQNDTLLDGGGSTGSNGGNSLIVVGTEFISTSDAQIANIQGVALASAGTLDLSNQTEDILLAGLAGFASITGGSGNDTIWGHQSDTLLDGGDGTADTLTLGIFESQFTSTSDSQIVNIEKVQLLNSITLDLSNQTEGFTITGSAGNDTIIGGSGADSIFAGDGEDTVTVAENDTLLDGGGGGLDTLQVGANFTSASDAQIVNFDWVVLTQAVTLNLSNQHEDFTIFGSAGADSITGGSGADTIRAGAGDDTIFGEQNDTWLDGGDGTDILRVGATFTSSASDNQITGIEQVLLDQASFLNLASQSDGFTITGSSGNDTIIGSSGSDIIIGGAGADSISGGAHNDTIFGEQNDTLLDGGSSIDTLMVGADFTSTGDAQIVNVENVVLTVVGMLDLSNQSEDFTITGSSGNDLIFGGSGSDSIHAGDGDDTIVGALNDTLLDGGAGVNVLRVEQGFVSNTNGQIVNIQTVALLSAGTLDLSGQREVLEILGTSGDDVIRGGFGADSIRAGAGNDTIIGTPSNPIISVENDTLLDGGADTDTLQVSDFFTSTSDAQIVNIEQVKLVQATVTIGMEATILGVTLDLSNQTEGFIIAGSALADSIKSGSGNDTIFGSENDTLLNGGGGTDTLSVAQDFTSTDDAQLVNIERVVLTSPSTKLDLSNQTEGFDITGSSGVDRIIGGSGDDTIRGGQSDAVLNGNGGNDTLLIGTEFTSIYDGQIVGIENVTLTSAVALDLSNQTEGFNITGSAGLDIIIGSAGDDTIRGVSGGERISGGGGIDTLLVDADFISVIDGFDVLIDSIENVKLTVATTLDLSVQTEGFTITGSSGADSITGGLGNDTIFGVQNDTLLNGGGGTDTLLVGANFTSAGDAQIANIENVVLTTAALTLDLSNQAEGFTITGSSGVDSITGGSGNDTIVGAVNDTLLDGSGGIDTLQLGADSTSVGDAQIVNIENVVLTAAAVLNLSNQTEGFKITGSSGNDTIIGGSGSNAINAGAGNDTIFGGQNDTLLDGGADTDTLYVGANLISTGDAQVANIENVVLTAALTLDLSNQSEGFAITGSSGSDRITGGAGNDTIVGAQNDTLLDGGAGSADLLQLAADFTSTGDAHLANMERVVLTAAATLNLSNQTEGFTITGSAGADSIAGGSGVDSISAGAGNDTIFGAQNDTLLDGGADTDTLYVGANFTSTGNGQIANIENVVLTTALTLDLSNQTESFTITGSSGADTIIGGSGDDTIIGAQNDTQLDGGDGTNTLQIGANFISTSNAHVKNITYVVLTSAVTLDLSNQVEGFFITGSSGSDSITVGSGLDYVSAGAGNDTISGVAQRIDGGADDDTFQTSVNFTGYADWQLVNIENVVLTAALTLDLSNQTEGFTITGSSGIDSITSGAGDDTIIGAQNDTLLDGGAGSADLLQLAADFTSTGDAHLANIENVTLTAAAVLNLSNQTEGFSITGSSGIDSITGGSGNDTIVGAVNDTLLDGGGGTDTLQIGAAFTSTGDGQIANIENVILTSAVTLNLANQTEGFTITGSSGADSIIGGSGNDTIVGAANDTLLNGGGGTDTLQIGASFTSASNTQIVGIEQVVLTSALTLSLANQTEAFTITGSSGNDSITGGSGADTIRAGAGNDTIVGASNDVLLDGGDGIDTLQLFFAAFTSSSDAQLVDIEQVTMTAVTATLNLANQTEGFTITGSTAGETIIGGSGADSISAGAGNDTIGGTQNDLLLDGGANTDTLQVGADFTSTGDAEIVNIENVTLTAAAVLNLANQTEGFTITGSSGVDTITGGTGADSISVGAGNDVIVGAQSDTLLDGGADTDTLQIAASFTSTSNAQIANIENVTLTAAVAVNLANQTEGFTITGSSGIDSITGGAGNDIIVGAANDTLLDGSGGSDTLRVGAAFTSTSDAQIANIENVTLTSAVALDLSNQTEGFTITGSSGADFIAGGTGADSISAGAGNDTIAGAQNDTLLDGGADTDTLQIAASFTSTSNAQIANIENVTLTAAAVLNLSNQTEGFTITGSSGIDSITGGAGNDIIVGAQNDTLLDGSGGSDTLQVDAAFVSASDAQIAHIENVLLTSAVTLDLSNQTEGFTITGSSGVDSIIGGSGVNSISAGAGNDVIVGAQSDTLLDGGADTDTLQIAASLTSVSDGQIVNIENVTLTAAAVLNLTNQTESFTITGSSGIDSITGGSGNDTIVGAVNDTLLDGSGGSDTLQIGATFTSTGDGQIVNIENVVLTAAVTLNLSNQTEGFTITGSSGADTITGSSGADSIAGGSGDDMIVGSMNDTLLDGGAGLDRLVLVDSGATLDLTSTRKVKGFEAIDLTGTGNNRLTLDRAGVLAEADADGNGVHVLKVDGNAGDTVSFVDVQWGRAGTVTEGSVTYTRYVNASGDTEVQVGQGVTVSFPGRFDLTDLRPSQGFIIQGDAAGDNAGVSVSSAGDVNGDGFADLIVGANLGDDGGTNAGEAYVVFGKASGFGIVDGTGRAVIDLTNVSSSFTSDKGFIIQGDTAGDNAGVSVSSAGDVNGDGFADLIVGAYGGSDGGTEAGEAYVVFGKASGFGTVNGTGRAVIDLTSLSTADGFIIQGDAAGDGAGWSVSSAGDVNADGFADLIVSAPWGDDGGVSAGEAYVVFGKASGFGSTLGGRAVIDLTGLSAADGFIIQGDVSGDFAGYSVSSAGDVNADGFADLIVGAYHGDDGGADAGEAYVIFGKASGFGTVNGTGRAVIDLTSLSAANGFVIQGDTADDNAGRSVSSAGDVNGDGFADLIVGAPWGDDGGTDAGEAYVMFGKASGFGSIVAGRAVVDLTSLSAANGFVIQGDAADDRAGWSVSSAGDVNGDGFADLIVGAVGGDDGGANAGEAYLLFGKASGFGSTVAGRAVIDLTGLSAADGFIIQGDAVGDNAGASVSSAGDVNGDGFADLIVAAPWGDDGGGTAGEAYVLFGGAFGGSTAPVTTTGTVAAEILMGGAGNDVLTGGGGADVFHAGAGNDLLSVGNSSFRLADGGSGSDTLQLGVSLTSANDGQIVNVENVVLTQAVTLNLSNQTEGFTITGSSGADTITAGSGNDRVEGGAGNDVLTGGRGSDTFVFAAVADSTPVSSDTIVDFTHGADHIDFANIGGIDFVQGSMGGSAIDAHSIAWTESGGNTLVYVNTSGASEAAGSAQMAIVLTGINLGLTANDFLFV